MECLKAFFVQAERTPDKERCAMGDSLGRLRQREASQREAFQGNRTYISIP
jgi:hypothetical protein